MSWMYPQITSFRIEFSQGIFKLVQLWVQLKVFSQFLFFLQIISPFNSIISYHLSIPIHFFFFFIQQLNIIFHFFSDSICFHYKLFIDYKVEYGCWKVYTTLFIFMNESMNKEKVARVQKVARIMKFTLKWKLM